jgi:hypothetical protein
MVDGGAWWSGEVTSSKVREFRSAEYFGASFAENGSMAGMWLNPDQRPSTTIDSVSPRLQGMQGLIVVDRG